MEKDILSGRLSVGQKLPSERELAERFAVSKAVIHAGILEMEESGFVLVRPRVGTFVSHGRGEGNTAFSDEPRWRQSVCGGGQIL